jgi:predicted ATPase
MAIKIRRIGISTTSDHRITKLPAFPKGHTFALDRGITWIVGENGTGKSTLLSAIKQRTDKADIETMRKHPVYFDGLENPECKAAVYYYDSEKSNPRSQPVDSMFTAASHFVSHGETTTAVIKGLDEIPGSGMIILIDEPESALSPWRQKEITLFLKKFSEERDAQIICNTHSIVFIESGFGSILELNNPPAKLVPASEYKIFP